MIQGRKPGKYCIPIPKKEKKKKIAHGGEAIKSRVEQAMERVYRYCMYHACCARQEADGENKNRKKRNPAKDFLSFIFSLLDVLGFFLFFFVLFWPSLPPPLHGGCCNNCEVKSRSRY